jgi:multidrug efflux pump subunit AcrB
MDITLNMVVLFSLILALGMLVDNAIAIVENIYRHRQEGQLADAGAYTGTKEVGLACNHIDPHDALCFCADDCLARHYG